MRPHLASRLGWAFSLSLLSSLLFPFYTTITGSDWTQQTLGSPLFSILFLLLLLLHDPFLDHYLNVYDYTREKETSESPVLPFWPALRAFCIKYKRSWCILLLLLLLLLLFPKREKKKKKKIWQKNCFKTQLGTTPNDAQLLIQANKFIWHWRCGALPPSSSRSTVIWSIQKYTPHQKERKKERTKLNDLFRDTDIRERKRESLHKDRRRPPPGQTDRQVVVGPVARCAFAYYINLAKLVVVGSNAMCNAMQCASEWSSSSRNRQWPHPRESLGRGLKREAGRRLFINRAKSLSPGHYCLASLLILLLLLLYVWGVLWCSALHLPPWERRRRRRRRRSTPRLDPLERVSLF